MTRLLTLTLLMVCVSCAHVVVPPTSLRDRPANGEHALEMIRWWVDHAEAAVVVTDALVELPLRVSEPRLGPKWGGVAAEDDDGARYTVTWHLMEGTLVLLLAREQGAAHDLHEHVMERLRLAEASHPKPDFPEWPVEGLNIQPNGVDW